MKIKRGDIWYIENGYSTTTGSEQRPGRPAVVVSNDDNNEHSTIVEVVYLTTQPKCNLPTHVNIRSTGRDSTAICEQVTSVSTERIGNYYCHVTDDEMADIEDALLISLDLGQVGYNSNPDREVSALTAELTEAQARCAVLQEMYDALLNRLIQH